MHKDVLFVINIVTYLIKNFPPEELNVFLKWINFVNKKLAEGEVKSELDFELLVLEFIDAELDSDI